MNPAVNEGVLRTFRMGILTSTSILANAPFAAHACAAWSSLSNDALGHSIPSADRRQRLGDSLLPFDIGVHLNLSQGRPLSGERYPATLLNDCGLFPGIGAAFQQFRAPAGRWRDAINAELKLQIEWVIEHGIRPTHLNGHQYVELIPGVSELIPDLLDRYAIPVVRIALEPYLARTVLSNGRLLAFCVGMIKRQFARKFQRRMIQNTRVAPHRYFGTSHAGKVCLETFEQFLRYASPVGCTEICVHPADLSDETDESVADGWGDALINDRPCETSWICGDVAPAMIASSGLKLGRLSSLASRNST